MLPLVRLVYVYGTCGEKRQLIYYHLSYMIIGDNNTFHPVQWSRVVFPMHMNFDITV